MAALTSTLSLAEQRRIDAIVTSSQNLAKAREAVRSEFRFRGETVNRDAIKAAENLWNVLSKGTKR